MNNLLTDISVFFYKIKRKAKHYYDRLTIWISDMDCWNLWYHIEYIIYEGLKKFQAKWYEGHPPSLTLRQWHKIVDDMVQGWKLIVEDKIPYRMQIERHLSDDIERLCYTKKEEKQMEKARELYAKWNKALWD